MKFILISVSESGRVKDDVSGNTNSLPTILTVSTFSERPVKWETQWSQEKVVLCIRHMVCF